MERCVAITCLGKQCKMISKKNNFCRRHDEISKRFLSVNFCFPENFDKTSGITTKFGDKEILLLKDVIEDPQELLEMAEKMKVNVFVEDSFPQLRKLTDSLFDLRGLSLPLVIKNDIQPAEFPTLRILVGK